MPEPVVIAIILFLILAWLVLIALMLMITYGMLAIRVPFVPVGGFVVDILKEEMPLPPGAVLYDLGSGDGRVVIGMAQAYPEAKVIGAEKGPFPYLMSRVKLFFAVPLAKNASFRFEDFSRLDLAEATHIYLYLFPAVVQGLLPRFEKELKPGTTVVTCDFPFKTREPERIVPVERGGRKYNLYFYRF